MPRFNTNLFCTLLLLFSTTTLATLIDVDEYTASSDLIPLNLGGAYGEFSLTEINDGIISDAYPFNGFATSSQTGSIRFDFDTIFNLDSSTLWNDINVGNEGIRSFSLAFFNADNNEITTGFSTEFTAVSMFDGQVFSFAQQVANVSWVNLEILNASSRIEIREVGFDGSVAITSVPVPATLWLFIPSLLLIVRRIN